MNKLNMNEQGIIVEDNYCWCCGKEFNDNTSKTIHHCLPKHLLPKKNVQIPICHNCHDKVTSNDMGALTTFAYALKKSSEEMVSRTNQLIKLVKV